MKSIIKSNGWVWIILGLIVIAIGFSNYNFKNFGIYKWGHASFCKTAAFGYRGRSFEIYFGKWLFTIHFEHYKDKMSLLNYYFLDDELIK